MTTDSQTGSLIRCAQRRVASGCRATWVGRWELLRWLILSGAATLHRDSLASADVIDQRNSADEVTTSEHILADVIASAAPSSWGEAKWTRCRTCVSRRRRPDEPDRLVRQRCLTRPSSALKHMAMLSTATTAMASAADARSRAFQPVIASDRRPSRM